MLKKSEEELSHHQKILLRFFGMKAWDNMKNAIRKLHPSDLVALFPHMNREERLEFLDVLFQEGLAAEVITYLPEEMARDLLEEIEEDKLATMIQRLSTDDAVDFLGYLDDEKKSHVLGCLPNKQRWFFEKLLLYEEDTAGGIMNTDFLALDQSLTVEAAQGILRDRFRSENYLYAYVVDEMNNLIGVLSFRKLVFSDPVAHIRDIMIHDPVRVASSMPQEDVAKLVADYDLLAIPVVDENNKLIGVVTVDDVIDVISEEATEDMYHLANLHSEVNIFTPLLRTVRLRLSLILASLVSAMISAWVVWLFRDTLGQLIWLAVLIPVMAHMTAAIGTQSLTVVVRAMILGELDFGKGWWVVTRELTAGLLIGLINGALLGLVVWLWMRRVELALLAGVSLVVSLLLSAVLGAFIPQMLRWMRLDPARGSNLVVTTLSNVAGFFVFLGLAHWMIGRLV